MLSKIRGVRNEERGFGICRFCGKSVKLMKNKKHLYTHAQHHHSYYACYGSRRLDYKNRNLEKISETFGKV